MLSTHGSRYEVYINSLQEPAVQQEPGTTPGTRPTSSAKQDAYTEALKRSLMESQVREILGNFFCKFALFQVCKNFKTQLGCNPYVVFVNGEVW